MGPVGGPGGCARLAVGAGCLLAWLPRAADGRVCLYWTLDSSSTPADTICLYIYRYCKKWGSEGGKGGGGLNGRRVECGGVRGDWVG